MNDSDVNKITEAASAVMAALLPLSADERLRVLDSAAALFGVRAPARKEKNDDSGNGSSDSESPAGGVAQPPGKPLSIVEFLNSKEPATNSQRIACFAHYREYVEGKPRFARADLEGYFSAAKLAKPGNYDRDFAKAVGEGWVHEDGASSYLTQNGERAVANGFGGKGKPRGATTPRKKKSTPAPIA